MRIKLEYVGESGKKWEIMLFGSYEHTLDEKNRLVIPSKMRNEIGTHLYIMKGFDGALSIFPEASFQKLMNEFQTLPFNKSDARTYLRVQLANASDLDLDKAGRAVIPSILLAKFNISKEVIIIGMGDHIEVWDLKTYKEYEAEAESKFESIAENLTTKED